MNERKSRGGVGGHSALAAGRGNATKCNTIFPQLHQHIFPFFWCGIRKKERAKAANECSLSNRVPKELT